MRLSLSLSTSPIMSDLVGARATSIMDHMNKDHEGEQ